MKNKRKTISLNTRKEVYEKYNGHCAYCGCELEYKDMQIDHIIPKHLEDKYEDINIDDVNNYMPSCRQCNFYKSTFTIETFRERIQTINDRLKSIFIYKLALKYGLIKEINKSVIFYFEKYNDKNNKSEH